MFKRLIAILLLLILAAGLVWGVTVYFDFVSQTIYEESTAHLREIFHQTNQTLYNLVSVNWGRMRLWVPYLSIARSEGEIIDYVNLAKEESNFTDFFFISRNGYYISLDGQEGYLDLRYQLARLILDREPVVINSVVPDKPEIMVFAIPAEPGTYRGFSYEAIVPVEDTVTLESQGDIHNLFQMTPYYWKTPKAGAERLAALDTLTTRISFRIHIFRKL